MASLALVASHTINGVACAHTELLKGSVFKVSSLQNIEHRRMQGLCVFVLELITTASKFLPLVWMLEVERTCHYYILEVDFVVVDFCRDFIFPGFL